MNVDVEEARVKQINLSSLNHAVNVLSTSDDDRLQDLADLSLKLLNKIKKMDLEEK